MSKSVDTSPNLSTRGGAAMLKSISLFLAGSRSTKAPSVNQPTSSTKTPTTTSKSTKPKRKKMTEKDIVNKSSLKILEAAKKDTHFTKTEIDALYKIYRQLVGINKPKQFKIQPSGSSAIGKHSTTQEGIDKMVFCEILHNTFDIVTEDMLMDRIFCVWDKTNEGLVTLETWFHGLSIFLRGTTKEKIEFCFAVYDLNADGFITKDEMFQLLKNCLVKHPQEEDPDESVKDLVEIVLRKLDQDKDGKVSLEDFNQTVVEEPLLLEAFGRCLPTERARETFLTTMKA